MNLGPLLFGELIRLHVRNIFQQRNSRSVLFRRRQFSHFYEYLIEQL